MSKISFNANSLSAAAPAVQRAQPLEVQRFSYYSLTPSDKVSEIALNFFKNIANYFISAANYIHSLLYSNKERAVELDLDLTRSSPSIEPDLEEISEEGEVCDDAVDDTKITSFEIPATNNAEEFCAELDKKECNSVGFRNIESSFSKDERELISSLYLKQKMNSFFEENGWGDLSQSEKLETAKIHFTKRRIDEIHQELNLKLSNLSDRQCIALRNHLINVTPSKKHEIIGFILGACSLVALKSLTSYSYLYTLAEKAKEYQVYGSVARGALSLLSFANKGLSIFNFAKTSKDLINKNPAFKALASLVALDSVSTLYSMSKDTSHAIATQVPFISARVLSSLGSGVCSNIIGKSEYQKKSLKRGFDLGLEKANNLYIFINQLDLVYSVVTAGAALGLSALQNYLNETNTNDGTSLGLSQMQNYQNLTNN